MKLFWLEILVKRNGYITKDYIEICDSTKHITNYWRKCDTDDERMAHSDWETTVINHRRYVSARLGRKTQIDLCYRWLHKLFYRYSIHVTYSDQVSTHSWWLIPTQWMYSFLCNAWLLVYVICCWVRGPPESCKSLDSVSLILFTIVQLECYPFLTVFKWERCYRCCRWRFLARYAATNLL